MYQSQVWINGAISCVNSITYLLLKGNEGATLNLSHYKNSALQRRQLLMRLDNFPPRIRTWTLRSTPYWPPKCRCRTPQCGLLAIPYGASGFPPVCHSTRSTGNTNTPNHEKVSLRSLQLSPSRDETTTHHGAVREPSGTNVCPRFHTTPVCGVSVHRWKTTII